MSQRVLMPHRQLPHPPLTLPHGRVWNKNRHNMGPLIDFFPCTLHKWQLKASVILKEWPAKCYNTWVTQMEFCQTLQCVCVCVCIVLCFVMPTWTFTVSVAQLIVCIWSLSGNLLEINIQKILARSAIQTILWHKEPTCVWIAPFPFYTISLILD